MGHNLIEVFATDTAGNVGTDSVTVRLDKTAPSISGAITAGNLTASGWYNGPVTVTITAIPGGGLLGDLLCSLSNLLNNNGSPTAVQALLWQISRVLGGLLA